ncbi:hypothetical protein [Pseudochryseolinea flava]|nr:hypothetical protein [Pseudochryseolinea flava]
MKTINYRSLFWIFVLAMSMTSCELVGDIFSAGVYTGIFLVVFVVVIIIVVIARMGKKG